MTITLIVVAVVYGALLWVNAGIENQYVTAAKQAGIPQGFQWGDWDVSPTPAVDAAPVADQPVAQVQTVPETKPEPRQAAPEVTVPEISAFYITGVSMALRLDNSATIQQKIAGLWERFNAANSLHEAVNWRSGKAKVYAYYSEFDSQFSKGRMVIGYASDTLQGTTELSRYLVQGGAYSKFAAPDINQGLPDEVWQAAYPDGQILEQYTMNTDGQFIDSDVRVIKGGSSNE